MQVEFPNITQPCSVFSRKRTLHTEYNILASFYNCYFSSLKIKYKVTVTFPCHNTLPRSNGCVPFGGGGMSPDIGFSGQKP